MRKELEQIEGIRTTFTAEFVRTGLRNNWHGYPEQTVLLANVRDGTGKLLTDHHWFKMTQGFRALGTLSEGDKIQFDGRVDSYVKGYVDPRNYIDDRTIDYRISRPTKIIKLNAAGKDAQIAH
ncbi:MAG: hypothetical protein P4L33_02625 [Capsulimonadaceae bacterium]|nr:hypothetical protein [Capsulimonadaceae bacterium]